MRRLAPAALLVLLLIVAGCGGGGGPSKADFSTKANAICQDTKDASYALTYGDVSPLSPEATTADLHRYADGLDRAVVLFGGEVDGLRKLKPPQDFVQGFADWVGVLGTRVERLRHAAAAGHRGDRATLISDLRKTGVLNTRAESMARVYGLESCAGTQ